MWKELIAWVCLPERWGRIWFGLQLEKQLVDLYFLPHYTTEIKTSFHIPASQNIAVQFLSRPKNCLPNKVSSLFSFFFQDIFYNRKLQTRAPCLQSGARCLF